MLQQLCIGTLIISATVMTQVLFISVAMAVLNRFGPWLIHPPSMWKTVVALIGVVLWLVAGISVCAWIWASVFLLLDMFEAIEPALYFSIVTFTTLGYGDITLDTPWRLLSGLTAANGLIIFGLNTAFLVEFIFRLRSAQTQQGIKK